MHLRPLVFGVATFLVLGLLAFACGGGEAAQDGGAAKYEMTVRFNTSATQDDLKEVGDFLRTFDADLDYRILESFPPIGHVTLATDASNFCQTVEQELEGKEYIDGISCGPAPTPEEAPDGDEPVSSGPISGSVAPNTFLTFNGEKYRLTDLVQADLVPQSEFTEIGVASEADIDYEGELRVYRRQGDKAAVYTFSPPVDAEGEEGVTPALWLKWEPE